MVAPVLHARRGIPARHARHLRLGACLITPVSPRVRAVAKLAKRAARSETGLFLLEGPQAVSEALTFRPELVVELFATPTALERYTDIARWPRRRGRRRRVRHRAGARRDGRHRHPAGLRRGLPPVPDLDQGHLRRRAQAHRDPRRGARPRQRRHDHPGSGCRGRRRRDPHRPQRRPVQPQGRALDHRLDLPPARRRRRRPRRRARARAVPPALQILAADVKGDDLLEARTAACSPSPPPGCSATRPAGSPTKTWLLADRSVSVPHLRPRRVDEPRDRRVASASTRAPSRSAPSIVPVGRAVLRPVLPTR